MCCSARVGKAGEPPKWIKPQLTRSVDEAPASNDWLHEVKYDGYRMHARVVGEKAQLLTRTGLDWSKRYRFTIKALRSCQALQCSGRCFARSGDVRLAYPHQGRRITRHDGHPAFAIQFSSVERCQALNAVL